MDALLLSPSRHVNSLHGSSKLVFRQRGRNFVQLSQRRRSTSRVSASAVSNESSAENTLGNSFDLVSLNNAVRANRRDFLEQQALDVLRKTLEIFERPAFPCALIAGDVVILDLLHKLGAFRSNKVNVIFIDTFHLFPETYEFLKECEKRYGFRSHVFHAENCKDKNDYLEKYGSDLFIRDIDEYDRICKVEPFGRALLSLQVDAMINGRRRDHGAERAHLESFEFGDIAKVQPLAYWEFRDCFEYLSHHQVPYHPLHDQGFPSVGDFQTTLPVPKEKWFEYGGERAGRFQGFKNKDGSEKTECGIHVGDARQIAQQQV